LVVAVLEKALAQAVIAVATVHLVQSLQHTAAAVVADMALTA
jgi:hypothetical protein